MDVIKVKSITKEDQENVNKWVKHIREQKEKENSPVYICEELMKDVEKYVESKCPSLASSDVMDIAAYCANRMMVSANDIMWNEVKCYRDRYDKELERAERKIRSMARTIVRLEKEVDKG